MVWSHRTSSRRLGPDARTRRAGAARRVALLVVALALAGLAPSAPADAVAAGAHPPPLPGPYRPPVDAPVIDPFRPPEHEYGPGNRGLSYGVAPLTPIRAAGDGEVIFAGQVGGTLHVTIRHPDGLRTSSSFLAAVAVQPGMQVALGTVIGWSSEVFHFGVRTPDGSYLDPTTLWAATWEAALVPGGDDGSAAPPEAEVLQELVRARAGPLSSWLTSGGTTLLDATTSSLADLERRLLLWSHYASELRPAVHVERLLAGLDRWADQRDRCTPASVPVPPPVGRRIVIEVGGIGSTSDAAAVADLDVEGLGYEPADVIRFSYAGGRVPPEPGLASDPFAAVTTSAYGTLESQQDLEESGRRLSVLIDEVARAAPGVPIDVIAHSQGGVVSRLALRHGERTGTLPDEVDHLVTLGSPHQGADLATTIEAARLDPTVGATLDAARRSFGVELDPGLPAASQLSEVSPLVLGLADDPVPPGVAFRSIAARGDVVVAEGRTRAPGATHATVSLTGVSAHDRLPSSAEATREVALALGGRPPTCRSLHDVVVDVAVGDGIGLVEDLTGAAALGLGVRVGG